ncbi:MAG: CoA transferase, partial [Nocardioidaceae bacterium]|nr:CoA transferase [Nocardioidaceae bacterium]
RSQGLVIDVEHESLGEIQLAGPPLRFFDPEGRETTPSVHKAPPTLDADGAEIRRWLATEGTP